MADGMVRLEIEMKAGALEFDKRALKKSLRAAGREIAAVAKALILRSQGTGRTYYRKGGGKYRASAPGQAPVSRTGKLASDFVVRPFRDGEGVAIRNTAFYSLFLEKGAHGGGGDTRPSNLTRSSKQRFTRIGRMRRMKKSAISGIRELKPRPDLMAALEQRADSIRDRLRAAVLDGVKFQRVRA